MSRPLRSRFSGRGSGVIALALAAATGCAAAVPAATRMPGQRTPAPPSASPPPDVGLEDAGLPTLLPESVLARVPTRVVVRGLGIDLAVVAPPGPTSRRFPDCNVAEFLPTLSRPGRPGTTFLYAHARAGMFLPILEASLIREGRSIVGLRVDVFTSDDRLFTYEVTEVLRHVVSLDDAFRATSEHLILQTSEGPRGTPGKTMLVARPLGETDADPEAAHPEAEPLRC